MHAVPTDARVAMLGTASEHPVAATGTDAAEPLGIEMDEFARPLALVAHDRRPWLQAIEPVESMTAQDGVDRRARESHLPRQHMGTDPLSAAAGTQLGDRRFGVTAGLVANHARAINQAGRALEPMAMPPLGAALTTDAAGLRGASDSPTGRDAIDQELPSERRQTGTSMSHEGPSSFDCGFDTSSRTIGALSPSITRLGTTTSPGGRSAAARGTTTRLAVASRQLQKRSARVAADAALTGLSPVTRSTSQAGGTKRAIPRRPVLHLTGCAPNW